MKNPCIKIISILVLLILYITYFLKILKLFCSHSPLLKLGRLVASQKQSSSSSGRFYAKETVVTRFEVMKFSFLCQCSIVQCSSNNGIVLKLISYLNRIFRMKKATQYFPSDRVILTVKKTL